MPNASWPPACLLSDQTSRRNKIALLAEYRRNGMDIKHSWQGVPYRSRLFLSVPGALMIPCKSYDEDIHPYLENHNETKVLRDRC